MTDTVNVTREDVARAVMDSQPYVSGWDAAYRIADSVLSMLEAAPKVEQEPVICHHEAYQGSCAHCGVKIVNGFAVMPRAHPAPSSELLEAADFLADRVADHEHSLEADDFYGHVLPALSRYRLAKHKGPQS